MIKKIFNRKLIQFVCLSIIFQIKTSECDKNKSDDRSLYENSTAILSAIPSNLKQLIYEKPYSSLVFFYQNWPEESLEQVKINLELEKELAYWQRTLKFITLNYDSQNARDFNITGSFVYKLSRPNIRSSHLLDVDFKQLDTKENIIKSTISALLKLNKTNQELADINWPKLNSLKAIDFNQTNLFSNKTLLFVNKGNSIDENLISLKISLDFSNYTYYLDILNCDESVFLNSNQAKQHFSYPALYQFVETGKSFNLIQQGLSRIEFRDLIKSKFLTRKWNQIEIDTKSRIKNVTQKDRKFKIDNSFPVYLRDLNNALRRVIFADFTR